MKKLLKGLVLGSICGFSALALASCDNGEASTTTNGGAQSTSSQYNFADKITLNFGGSTSVEKIAKALTASFAEECPRFEANHNHTGSGDAYKRTQGSEKSSENKLHMGFLSRELKSSEACAEGTSGLICKDGIVAVVNAKNDAVTNLTAAQLKSIYSSNGSVWQTYGTSSSNFDTSKTITRYSRDTTSGTRDGFFTTIGYEEAKADDTKIPGASITSSNGDMIAKVKADDYGIGYISLASLESSGLKGLKYEGIEATESGVIDGTYKLQRNFNYCTRSESDCTNDEWLMLQCFLAYMNSQEGLAIIKSKDGILTKKVSEAKSWDTIKNSNEVYKALCSK